MNLIKKDFDLLNWFDENYIQSKQECEELLIRFIKDYPINIESIYCACSEIVKYKTDKSDLFEHLKFFSELANAGISASKAGESIRKIL